MGWKVATIPAKAYRLMDGRGGLCGLCAFRTWFLTVAISSAIIIIIIILFS